MENKIDCKKERLNEIKLMNDEISKVEKEVSKEIHRLKKQLSALTSSVTNKIKAERFERIHNRLLKE